MSNSPITLSPATTRALLEASVALAQARDRLLAVEPDLPQQDPRLWQDMLEGETVGDPYAVIDAMVMGIGNAADLAEACRKRQQDLDIRHARFTMRAQALRNAVQSLLESLDLTTLERPTYTAAIGHGPDKVQLTVRDPLELAPRFQRVCVEANKTALREALEAGETDIGAVLSNGGAVLRIRTT